MNKQFTFRNMEHSNTLEEHANEQLQKVEKFLEHEKEPIYLHIILTAHHIHAHHQVEFQVTTPLYKMSTHREGPELYQLISEVIDIMYERLTEAKRENVEKWHTGIKRE